MPPKAVLTIVAVVGGLLTAVLRILWLPGRPFGPGDARVIARGDAVRMKTPIEQYLSQCDRSATGAGAAHG